MLHRDISINNIMHQKRGGYDYFVLIDFDMAVELPKDSTSSYIASSKHRTGTLPFMAHELVSDAYKAFRKRGGPKWVPKPHLLRHDYQSLFWVSLWCLLTLYRKDLNKDEVYDLLEILRMFESGNLSFIASHKESLTKSTLEEHGVSMPPGTECLRSWFEAWNQVFCEASAAFNRYKFAKHLGFDEETMGGYFTRDTLKAALTPCMPLEQANIEVEDEDEDDLGYFEDDIPVQNPVEPDAEPEPEPQPERRTRASKNAAVEAAVQRPTKVATKRQRRTQKKAKVPAKAPLKIRPDVQGAGGPISLPAVQNPIKASKPPPVGRSRKRKREEEDEVAPNNDIRSRLRPRREINYKY